MVGSSASYHGSFLMKFFPFSKWKKGDNVPVKLNPLIGSYAKEIRPLTLLLVVLSKPPSKISAYILEPSLPPAILPSLHVAAYIGAYLCAELIGLEVGLLLIE